MDPEVPHAGCVGVMLFGSPAVLRIAVQYNRGLMSDIYRAAITRAATPPVGVTQVMCVVAATFRRAVGRAEYDSDRRRLERPAF